uniref:Ras-GAP domain-containing protein n=1 Tax=Lotharella globosa TaxID=91324 RepID=A0A7S3Z0F1_9EUKA|mmetsp:Transcript_18662/g.37729  ORF Transcript_18662/g.37729 Transcript_18662/m.37729 type:complete len:354 (+) Transcript_18662:127-1188(+)
MDSKGCRLDAKQRTWLGDGLSPDKIQKMLTEESDLRLVLRMMEANNAPKGAVAALYHVFERGGRADFLIRVAVAMEVHGARGEAMILRYENKIGPSVDAIVSEYLESPNLPAAPSPDHEVVKNFSVKILAAALLEPPPRAFSAFVASLLTNVNIKFPKKHLRVCAGHLFLRVLCPRILRVTTNDTTTKDKKEAPEEHRRRKLILSKALQAIFLPSSAKPPPPYTVPHRKTLHKYLLRILDEGSKINNPRASSINSAENGRSPPSKETKGDVDWGKDTETIASYLESLLGSSRPVSKTPKDTVIKVMTGQMKQMLGIEMEDAEIQHKIYFGGIVVGLLTLFILRSWATLQFNED